MKRSATILISAASGFVLLAAGTTAGAAIAGGPIDSSGVIHACYANVPVTGLLALHLVNAGSPCPTGMTAITWNQQGPAGSTGPAGPAGPAGATGPPGPKGDTGAQGLAGPAGATGPPGSQGPAGSAGADGSTVLNGTGAPADTLGHDGDFYLDTAAEMLYGPKAGGTWPTPGTSLVGPVGPQGSKGDTGAAGPAGPPGPAGTGLASLDDLNGMPCHNGTGIVQVTYSSFSGPVSIQCTATNTNTSPDTAQDLGTISCGGVSSGGTVTATQSEWFKITFTGCIGIDLQPQPLAIRSALVSGVTAPMVQVFSPNDLSIPLFTGQSVTIPGTDIGTFLIRVIPEPGAGTTTYTMTATG